MSDNVLSVVPTDPYWRPSRDVAERATTLVAALVDPDAATDLDIEIDVTWHDRVAVVDCGANLERINCPHCGSSIDPAWWAALVEERSEDGFTSLDVEVPCCGARTSLDTLDYDWPCAFASFEITIWNPDRDWFSDQELTALADVLGHPLRQVMAHY